MSKNSLEREIEEILARLDRFVPEERRLPRLRRRLGGAASGFLQGLRGLMPRVSVGQMMLAAFLLIVLAYLLRVLDVPTLARYAVIAGLVLFLVAFALALGSGGRTRYEKRWRGEVMNLSGPSLGGRIRGWFRRSAKKNRRR